jgi:prophage DNA circulation protein
MSSPPPSSLGPLVQNLGTSQRIDTSGASWLSSSWWAQLQPGSWRGVGFVMDSAELKTGRRTALHEYPYRDTVWVEDLGKLPRHFAFQAFLVGDDVYQQRDAMVAACEKAGAGTLVHPTMGSVQCVLVDFTTTDRRERGRLVEVAFQFIISGDVQPGASIATGENVLGAASALTTAAAGDLRSNLAALTIVPQAALSTASQFAGLAVSTVNDATRALNAVRGLQGYFGRYATGRMSTMLPISATVSSVLSAATTTRAAVLDAANAVQNAAAGL